MKESTNTTSKREKLLKAVLETYQSVYENYNNIFSDNMYLPTKSHTSLGINGFTERNLTFNFCHSYLGKHTNAIVWQEIPFDSRDLKRQHVDSIIIDKGKNENEDNNWVIYLEAKRLYDISHLESLLEDLDRIKKYHSSIPIPNEKPTTKAVVLLADHFYHGENSKSEKYKKNYYDKFFTSNDIIEMPETNKLKKTLRKDIEKINNIPCEFKPITIDSKKSYNINIIEDIYYTIYCGVYFIE